MPSNKKGYPNGQQKNNGKKELNDQLQQNKMTVKYTFGRSKEDIKKINKLRNFLKNNDSFSGSIVNWEHRTWNTDSEIYHEMPDLFFLAINTMQQLQQENEELTAKLDEMQDLKNSISHIIEIVKGVKK